MRWCQTHRSFVKCETCLKISHARDMSTVNITKGMCSSHMGNMCLTHTRVNASSPAHKCAVRYSLSISRSSSTKPLGTDPSLEEERGWCAFIPDVGRCQLTRNAPFSGGLGDDICTWHNFVNNDVSPEQILRESISDVKRIVPHIRQPCANLTLMNKMRLRAFIARMLQSFRSNFRFNDRYLVIGVCISKMLNSCQVPRLQARLDPRGFTRIRFLRVCSRTVKSDDQFYLPKT